MHLTNNGFLWDPYIFASAEGSEMHRRIIVYACKYPTHETTLPPAKDPSKFNVGMVWLAFQIHKEYLKLKTLRQSINENYVFMVV